MSAVSFIILSRLFTFDILLSFRIHDEQGSNSKLKIKQLKKNSYLK